jgi:hypothetical protein
MPCEPKPNGLDKDDPGECRRPANKPIRDLSSTANAAEECAAMIRFYWQTKGHTVSTSISQVAGLSRIFQIRSSLKDGSP